jgi:hypothetical protein
MKPLALRHRLPQRQHIPHGHCRKENSSSESEGHSRDACFAASALGASSPRLQMNCAVRRYRGIPMKLFGKRQSLVLWCLPALLALSGCGEAGPECGSSDARNSVVKIIADNTNNSLLNYAIQNSSSVAEMLSNANADAEKSAIREKAKQGAIYTLDNTIVVNSTKARVADCTGILSVKVGDMSAEKEVEFTVEQTADGKISVSVMPFLF